jgi:hypothetical protein
MKEKDLVKLGWKFDKKFINEEYTTVRYKMGCMEIDFNYEGEKFLDCDLTILELIAMPIDFEKAKIITELIGDWN